MPAEAPDDSGAVLVEFALVVPFLIMLVLAVVQFGLVLNRQQGLHAAAREGARVASFPDATRTDIEGQVDGALSGVALDSGYTVSLEPDTNTPCSGRSGQMVTVTIATTSALDVPFLTNQTINMEGKGSFRCE